VAPPDDHDGDAGSDSEPPGRAVDAPDADDPAPTVAVLVDELADLERTAPTEERRERLRELQRLAADVRQPATFGRTIVGFDRTDAGEAFLGAVLFGVPMFVEGGTAEVAAHLVATPAALAATVLGTVALVVGILYVADFQDVRVHDPILGVVPRRLAGVLAIAAVTAAGMLTLWGRVDWASPALALAQVAVATLPMTVGAALGDILPGT
jgi:uncharacterized membrane protein